MDAVTAFVKQENGEAIEGFVVSGISKRGWTTWLTGAVDPRVKAIAPQVIDMLNMKKQIAWAQKVYGRQSEQIQEYTDLNLHLSLDEPRNVNLRSWVDPYSYRNRYTMPKLLLLGTNDRYWTVDSLRHYWDDLPGPKLIFQTPNAGHEQGDRKDSKQTLAAFFEMIADGKELPKMSWTFKGGEKPVLDLTIEPAAESIRLFTTTSRDRDFRDETWTSRVLQDEPSSRATGFVPAPTQGYRAFMGEVTLKSPRGHPYKLSTQVRVEPDDIK
jgi:PhoPQ-activated pathogenicity-related protein